MVGSESSLDEPSRWDVRASRFLGLVGRDDPETLSSKLGAFITLFVLHCAVREWVSLYDVHGDALLSRAPEKVLPLAIWLSLCTLATLTDRYRNAALYGLFMGLTFKLVEHTPTWSNHFTVEWITSVFLLMGARRSEGFPALCQALRWLVFIALFWSGLQKVLHGTYFQGTFLAFVVANSDRFADFFVWVLPAWEFDAIRSTALPGPYRFESWMGLAISNVTWIAEMCFSLLLLTERFRMLAVVGAAVLLVGIEIAARELMFGLLFLNLLLLYPRRDLNRRLLPAFGVAYALILWNRVGLVDFGLTN